jgi:ferredoxin-thioredoxin reductase catalytic subunit
MCNQTQDEEAKQTEARARVERMVRRYLSQGRYVLNPDPVTVEHVMAGLARNLVQHGRWYCPCREVVGDPELDRKNICPCPQHHADIAREGACECGIFVSHEFAQAQQARADTGDKEES